MGVTVLACVLIGLIVTSVGTVLTVQRERRDAALESRTQLIEVGNAIDRQVSRYTEVLYGLRASFARDPALSRQEFRELVDIDALTRRNPGAQLISFDRFVPTKGLTAFQHERRKEFPDFAVHPKNASEQHLVVDYLEPIDTKSPAFGLDIADEPVRRSAYEFARDSGEPSATTPLTLVQNPVGQGFLLMLAAYDITPLPVTGPARSRHFLGILVAVFETQSMIEQAMDTRPGLAISIYDAGTTVDTPRDVPRPRDWIVGKATTKGSSHADIDVGGRRWRLVADTPIAASIVPPIAVATSGTALTLMVAMLLAAMTVAREQALSLAAGMTADLRASEERLQAANEAMQGFVAVAAHDLRSPLASIVGFAELLHDNWSTLKEENRRKFVASIDRQSRHLSLLVNDLLTLSSIDGGAMNTRPERIELARAIGKSLEAGGESGADVVVSCAPDLVVLVDPNHLGRILDNYIQNAFRYGAPPIRIEAHHVGEFVEVQVTDHGDGVPPEFVHRLFGKFARADTEVTRSRKGTGLGLSIVRGLAEANGGSTRYEPNLPHGSCFIVSLPAADGPQGSRTAIQ